MMVIFLLSSQPVLPGPNIIWMDFFFKKLAHMFVYAVLYFLIFRALNYKKSDPNFLLPLLFTIMYAATDELHQFFVPGRTATVRDLGFDLYGAFLAVLKKQKII